MYCFGKSMPSTIRPERMHDRADEQAVGDLLVAALVDHQLQRNAGRHAAIPGELEVEPGHLGRRHGRECVDRERQFADVLLTDPHHRFVEVDDVPAGRIEVRAVGHPQHFGRQRGVALHRGGDLRQVPFEILASSRRRRARTSKSAARCETSRSCSLSSVEAHRGRSLAGDVRLAASRSRRRSCLRFRRMSLAAFDQRCTLVASTVDVDRLEHHAVDATLDQLVCELADR